MHHLKQENVNGVITFSTGNHGISIALAAKRFNIPATIVLPKNSNEEKIQLIRETGARLIEEGENFDEASKVCRMIQEKGGLRFLPKQKYMLYRQKRLKLPISLGKTKK